MSQNTQILKHLKKHKFISPRVALEEYGCFRLAARISELRLDGHMISTTIIETTSKYGKKRYARYAYRK